MGRGGVNNYLDGSQRRSTPRSVFAVQSESFERAAARHTAQPGREGAVELSDEMRSPPVHLGEHALRRCAPAANRRVPDR